MRLIKATIFFPTLLLIFISCSSTKNISGIYHSNFAVIGFFGIRITLKSDSTLSYRMRGDMMGDTATGKYKTQNRFLILTYDPPATDTSLYSQHSESEVHINQTLSNSSTRPKQLYIGHNKLFIADTLGNIYKTAQGFSRHKKYLFWGQHYMTTRKYYLKRVE